MKYSIETYIILMNMLIASEFMLSCNDALEDTSAFKQQLKQRAKALQPELVKIIDTDLALLWGVDDPAMYGLQDGFKKFIATFRIDRFKTIRPEQIAGFSELMEMFFNAPELVLKRNGITIINSKIHL